MVLACAGLVPQANQPNLGRNKRQQATWGFKRRRLPSAVSKKTLWLHKMATLRHKHAPSYHIIRTIWC